MTTLEFAPPKSLEQEKSFHAALDVLGSHADLISVSVGLGREAASLKAVKRVLDAGLPVMAHVTCAGKSRTDALARASEFGALGVRRILALRGDTPVRSAYEGGEGPAYQAHPDGFQTTADLVAALVDRGFEVAVAVHPEGHPDSRSIAHDVSLLMEKIGAGATAAFGMFSFDLAAVDRFQALLRAAGGAIPLHPGLMPVHPAVRFLAHRCGVEVPDDVIAELDGEPRAAAARLAAQIAAVRTAGNNPYIYTLNSVEPVLTALGHREDR